MVLRCSFLLSISVKRQMNIKCLLLSTPLEDELDICVTARSAVESLIIHDSTWDWIKISSSLVNPVVISALVFASDHNILDPNSKWSHVNSNPIHPIVWWSFLESVKICISTNCSFACIHIPITNVIDPMDLLRRSKTFLSWEEVSQFLKNDKQDFHCTLRFFIYLMKIKFKYFFI